MSYINGKMIKELREKRGLTQKELANLIMVSDKTISKWETSKGLPDIGILEDLANALGVSVAELMMGQYMHIVIAMVCVKREYRNSALRIRKTMVSL